MFKRHQDVLAAALIVALICAMIGIAVAQKAAVQKAPNTIALGEDDVKRFQRRTPVESWEVGLWVARRYYISGQVQGVGYRFFAQRVARDLRVRGWARNLADGRVEVLAIGTPRQLTNFEGELRVGPPAAEVRGLTVEDAVPAGVITGFSIR